MKNVLIFGTCASRDLFNYPESQNNLKLIDYFARSSLVSIFSPPLEASQYVDLESISSKFRKRCVQRDFDKSFIVKLKRTEFDILLIDFLDERLDLWEAAPGSYVTVSEELLEGHPDITKHATIEGLSESKIRMWEESWEKFIQFADENNILNKIRINKLYLTSKGFHGIHKGIFSSKYITAINEYLDKLYRASAINIARSQFIEYPAGMMRINPGHRWGKGPYHYIDDVYKYQIDHLSKLISEKYTY